MFRCCRASGRVLLKTKNGVFQPIEPSVSLLGIAGMDSLINPSEIPNCARSQFNVVCHTLSEFR